MIRHYCDLCGKEVHRTAKPLGVTVETPRAKLRADVTVAVKLPGSTELGIACQHCVLDALRHLESPRPTAWVNYHERA